MEGDTIANAEISAKTMLRCGKARKITSENVAAIICLVESRVLYFQKTNKHMI